MPTLPADPNLAPPDDVHFLHGVIERVTYRNEKNGFGVIRVQPQGKAGELVTLIGQVSEDIATGTNIVARGKWETHKKFGRQFRAFSVTETEPTSAPAILRYLSSGVIKGLGPVLAERIVSSFGEETLRVFDERPEDLRRVQGIGQKKLDEIIALWQEKKNAREVLLFFEQHNISGGLAQRIYRSYGTRAIEIVSKNPYLLTRDIWGIGFKTADSIAQAIGISLNSHARIAAGLAYILKSASDDGHCFLPKNVLLGKTASLLQLTSDSLIADVLAQIVHSGELICRGEDVYLPQLEASERELANSIFTLLSATETLSVPITNTQAQNFSQKAFTAPGDEAKVVTLSPEQQTAVCLAAVSPLLIITGGPGCGKTTVVRAISSLFRSVGARIKLAAPTGRAAQRLGEVCNAEASTIHRMLGFDPTTRGFLHTKADPLPLDVLILDESSMIDLLLAAALFQAIPTGARVILVGDSDQLPSVGPGRVLWDLLQIEPIPRIRLTTLFRRSEDSAITHIAYQVNQGLVPDIPQPDGVTKTDAYFLPGTEPETLAQLVERLIVEQIPKKFGIRSQDITVLSPMNKGDLGIIALNNRLQQKLVPHIPGTPVVQFGHLEFRLGDRVCQRVNNYQLTESGVFNGDQGEVIAIDPVVESITVKLWDGKEVEYPSEYLSQLDLAYAITIHRAQGSEVPAIVLVLHEAHSILLERQLIYTAITRAKRLLVIVGSKRALILSIKKTRSSRRHTALAKRVLELGNGGNI